MLRGNSTTSGMVSRGSRERSAPWIRRRAETSEVRTTPRSITPSCNVRSVMSGEGSRRSMSMSGAALSRMFSACGRCHHSNAGATDSVT